MTEVESNVYRPEPNFGVMECKPEPYSTTEVKMRSKKINAENASETQRKRRSKNRLSNRRSTGFVYEEMLKAAWEMGPQGENSSSSNQ